MGLTRGRWGLRIDEACRTSSVPPEFLAALIANESGGNPTAARFESGVFRHLQAVRDGRERAYGSLTAERIDEEIGQAARAKTHEYHAQFLTEKFADEVGVPMASGPLQDDQALRELATSWGLAQIMGYHLLGAGPSADGWGLGGGEQGPKRLLDPAFNLDCALRLLGGFAHQYQLDLKSEFEELFRCWNTGRPDGKTTDPQYVEKGLGRLEIYREVEQGMAPAARAIAPRLPGLVPYGTGPAPRKEKA